MQKTNEKYKIKDCEQLATVQDQAVVSKKKHCLEYFENLEPQSKPDRRLFIDEFLRMCNSNDLNYLSRKLDDYKRDFICLLPNELIEIVLNYLDWKSLLSCCQVELFLI
jgi:hypothetical protein